MRFFLGHPVYILYYLKGSTFFKRDLDRKQTKKSNGKPFSILPNHKSENYKLKSLLIKITDPNDTSNMISSRLSQCSIWNYNIEK